MSDYTASGAGEPAVNGTPYVDQGVDVGGGRHSYKYVAADIGVIWNGTMWIIQDWTGGPNYYENTDTGITPPLTGWTVGSVGTSPAPTLSVVGSSSSGGNFFPFF